MPTAVVCGVPPDIDRRVRHELQGQAPFGDWRVLWLRSNCRLPGLAPSQVETAARIASEQGGANLLIFRGRGADEESSVRNELHPYFRSRWIEPTLLKLIPHQINRFFQEISAYLSEEAVWIDRVKPRDESCCLLLPGCTFTARNDVRHVWSAASEAGIERIKLAARAVERFSAVHWLPQKSGSRGWTDEDGRVFDHRGARHGIAPFPRMWKYSYQTPVGFHFDVTSRQSRPFYVQDLNGWRHNERGPNHINIDCHGYVRT